MQESGIAIREDLQKFAIDNTGRYHRFQVGIANLLAGTCRQVPRREGEEYPGGG
jgi:hypothetical protein